MDVKDVIGLWEVVSAQVFDMASMGMVWKTREEAMASDMDEDFKRLYTNLFDFKEGGVLSMMMKGPAAADVPKEELDEAVAAGEAFVEDGFVYILQNYEWKEEGEDILIDSKERGEVLGEAINPWKPVVREGNTLIVLEHYQLCKVGETPDTVRKKEEKTVTPEMLAAVGTYKGLYLQMVGSETRQEEEFRLELKADGTGSQQRNGLDIRIPDWSLEGGQIKLTEKFLGTIEYTGTLEGTKLSLFNGDPANSMTMEYVYEKEENGV